MWSDAEERVTGREVEMDRMNATGRKDCGR